MDQSQAHQTQQRIEQLCFASFNPSFFEILNESHQHAGPATDSHFKVTLVSEQFFGLRPVARHRAVYQQLTELMPSPVHALALHTYTPQEWAVRAGRAPDSPNCRGGAR